MVVTGLAVHWVLGFPILVGLVFGAIISATDPISVLALFRDMAVGKRLSTLVEGESLLNDGTAAVLYGILVGAVMTGKLNVVTGVGSFFVEVLGGAAVGLGLGYLVSKITGRIDEPQIEITLTTILAYSSFLVAQSLHLSGVIATVAAGLMIGNLAIPKGMSPQTRAALWSFWEYASFVMNSIVFLIIGLEVHLDDLVAVLETPAAGSRSGAAGPGPIGVRAYSRQQPLYGKDFLPMAAHLGVGRDTRCSLPGLGVEPGPHLSLPEPRAGCHFRGRRL